jgi:hypothetical protein
MSIANFYKNSKKFTLNKKNNKPEVGRIGNKK